MYPKTSVVPPGGFHFREKHAGSEIELTGDSIETLALALEKYRAFNGIPAGNPRQDIVDYICGNWPHFCSDDSPTFTVGTPQSITAPLSRRVADWTTRLWNLGAENFVRTDEAERRAAICRACPLNQDFRAGGCASCVDNADRLVFIWLAGRKVADKDSLKACRATGAHLQADVFASRHPGMQDPEVAALAPGCWKK